MKAKDLIEKLQELPPDTEILVWAGENSACVTGDFKAWDAAHLGAPGARILE